jgi:hypothetical protein
MLVAMSSVRQMKDHKETGGYKASLRETQEAQRFPTGLGQNGFDAISPRSDWAMGAEGKVRYTDTAPAEADGSRSAVQDDQTLDALGELGRRQAEPTLDTFYAGAHEAVWRSEPRIGDSSERADNGGYPQPIFPRGVAHFPRLGSRRQFGALRTRRHAAVCGTIALTAALCVTAGISLRLHAGAADDRRVIAAEIPLPAAEPAAPRPNPLPTMAVPGTTPMKDAAAVVATRAALPPLTAEPAALEPSAPTMVVPGTVPLKEAAPNAVAAEPTVSPPVVSSPGPALPEVGGSLSEAAVLLQRGDLLLAAGDVASARLFYERAANGGDAVAALRLGQTYDSLFLAQVGLTGVHGDIAMAVAWYRRAGDLGASEARDKLSSLESR